MEQLPSSAAAPPVPARTRQLRTLLICDLADSTRLVDTLGDHQAADLIQRHDQLARTLIEKHHGREIDKTDGFLLLFERPSEAVAFALDYHRELEQLSGTTGTPMRARVGIHMGDVVSWANSAQMVARGAKPIEVEGLAKPTTARLAQLALPGQTLLSAAAASVARRAQDEVDVTPERLRWATHGRYRLKGLPELLEVVEVGASGHAPLRAPRHPHSKLRGAIAPITVIALVAAVGLWHWRTYTTTAATVVAAPANSLVVLPFVNLGNDPAQRYFSNGITEELTTELGKDTGLIVIAWETASRFGNSRASPSEIGKALDVAHILGGSIQRVGDKVRVSVELVSTTTGR